jgi:hypothetical protein
MPTSQEIKDQLREQSRFIPEAPDDDEGELGYTPSDSLRLSHEGIIEIPPEIEMEAEEEQPFENDESEGYDPEFYRGQDPVYDRLTDKERLAEERRQAEFERRKQYYENQGYESLPEPSSPGAQAYQKKIQQQQAWNELNISFGQDQYELRERYGEPLTSQFFADVQLGRVKLPKGLEEAENPMETVFLQWVSTPRIMKSLSGKQIENVIRAGSSGPPLQCRSLDFLIPARKKPAPKKKAEPKREYSIPELSNVDMEEMLSDFLKKHPEKMRR